MKEKNGNDSLTARQWERAAKNNSMGYQMYPSSEDVYSDDEEYSYYRLGGDDHNNPEVDNMSVK